MSRRPPIATGQPGGRIISPLTAQMLACDAEIVPISPTTRGGRWMSGTTIYPFPPEIRQAIEHADRHCTYPGCTAPATLVSRPSPSAASRDGPTSEDNGTLLCGRHHRFVHAKGWTGRHRRRPRVGDRPGPATHG